jgi:hypothetical protein
VSAGEIVEHFGLRSDRLLRAQDGKPGPLDNFAFSHPSRGIIHHRFLPQKDFIRLDNSLGRHAISELRKRKRRRQARRRCLAGNTEIHSGQILFSI